MKCFMRYLVRVIDIIPKDISKIINRSKMFYVKQQIKNNDTDTLDCGLWLIFFK